MGALAKPAQRSDPFAFEIQFGANGEWVVRGPEDRWGGLFGSPS